jgi:hypothetical protein
VTAPAAEEWRLYAEEELMIREVFGGYRAC